MAERKFTESRREMETILLEETIGYLGMSAKDEPYVVPLNYGYADGRILFHCALAGEKIEHLRANPRVCFTVGRQEGNIRRHAEGDPCHTNNDSVICRGNARIIEDQEERALALNEFNRCFQADADAIPAADVAKCLAVEIEIVEMTGRQERDGERVYWRHTFAR